MNDIVFNEAVGANFPAAISSGSDFVVAWSNYRNNAIKTRRVLPNGTLPDGETTVNDPTPQVRSAPAICRVGFEGYGVVWREGQSNPGSQLKLRHFTHGGATPGPEKVIAPCDPDAVPAMAFMTDGGFVATWTSPDPGQRIRVQRFDSQCNKAGPEFTANITPGTFQRPVVSSVGDGSLYVIAWGPGQNDPRHPAFRIFDFDGTPQTGEVVPDISGSDGSFEAVALLDVDGRFALAEVAHSVPSDLGVMQSNAGVNIYESTGSPAGLFAVTKDSQGVNSSWVALSGLLGGQFLLSWVERSAETFATPPAVMARVFTGASDALGGGTKGAVGPEVQASTMTTDNRNQVCVTTDFSDLPLHSLVAWSDFDGANDFAVHGKIFQVGSDGSLS
ncbi:MULTISPECIES: hypothetical protein [Streptomyces]|uniref:Uncharacterized protein n=1 Tax=Streptomyces ramulosus TaxID=47762 RepID=A0ABW1FI53_9ACTN